MRSGYEFDGHGGRTTRPDRDPEQHLAAFLSRVADLAAPQLSPAARSRLLESLRTSIAQERAASGMDVRTLDRILDALGDPITLVDAEVQRDPESQERLANRLTKAMPSPAVVVAAGVDSEVAAQLAPEGRVHTPVHPVGPPGSGPEICLDPDPFGMEHEYRPETVGALGTAPAAAPAAEGDGGAGGGSSSAAGLDEDSVGARLRVFWLGGPRVHPVETAAIVLLLAGAVAGQWLLLLAAVLVAFASRFYSPAEKWALLVGVPVLSLLLFAFGFWLTRHGDPGGTHHKPADLLGGVDSFFGPLPRMIALLGAMYLAWRLARGVVRRT